MQQEEHFLGCSCTVAPTAPYQHGLSEALNGAPRSGCKEYESYLVIANIGKRMNYGMLLRSAAAFGVKEVFVVGEKKLSMRFGSQGTTSFLRPKFFEDLKSLKTTLNSRNIALCGIEISTESLPVNSCPFRKTTAFMLGNEATGMSTQQKEICDFFVYVPQYGTATASLNVAICGSIVLHHFALWAGWKESSRNGQKFEVQRPLSKLQLYQEALLTDPQAFQRIKDKKRRDKETKGYDAEKHMNLMVNLFSPPENYASNVPVDRPAVDPGRSIDDLGRTAERIRSTVERKIESVNE